MSNYNKGHAIKQEYPNDGVILGRFSPATYVSGTIPYEVRNLTGNWGTYLPPGEWQASYRGDSMSCVSFSAINSIEIQEKFLTGNQFNYSDRWIAKMSGTTPKGNQLDKVAETIRTYGLVLESSYPTPENYTWDEYHADIPEPLLSKLKAEGKEWLEKWDIKYEEGGITKSALQQQLKQSCLQCVVPNHAVVDILSLENAEKIFDSYPPFTKYVPGTQYPSDIIYAMKIVLYQKEYAFDPDALLVDVFYGNRGTLVLKAKRALQRLGWFTDDNDRYDENMAEVVMNFKLANVCNSIWGRFWEKYLFRGREIDIETRNIINQALKYRK